MATSSGRERVFEQGGSETISLGLFLTIAVPTVLLWVHSLPRGARRGLALDFGDPTLVDAFTAHFVHLSTGHLLSNLVFYGVVVSVAYLLARRSDDLRTFRRGFLTVMLAFPPALSGLSVALGRPALGYGFSGLNMALFALLTVLLGRFLFRRFGLQIDDQGVVLFGLGVVLVAVHSLPTTTVTLGVAGSAACLSLASVVGGRRRRPEADGGWATGQSRSGDVELAVVAGIVFCAVPFVAFSPPSNVGAALGLYVHFLGYALSFTVLYVADAAGLLA